MPALRMKRVEVVEPDLSAILLVVVYLIVVVVVAFSLWLQFTCECWGGEASRELDCYDESSGTVSVGFAWWFHVNRCKGRQENKYDDVAGARRLECGGAKQVASSLREAPERLIAIATESLGGLTAKKIAE